MHIQILACQESDLDNILELAVQTEEIGDYEGETYEFFSKDRLQIMAGSSDVLFLVAHAGEVFAGFFILLVQRASGLAYIVDLALSPDYRRHGIGSLFIGKGLDFARQQGCEEVWCIVHEKNEAAWKLFEEAGFRKGKKFYYMGKSI